MTAEGSPALLPFDREAPCPACGIALEIRRVCRESHPGLAEPWPNDSAAGGATRQRESGADPVPAPEHLHVACPGCGWSGWMQVAGRVR